MLGACLAPVLFTPTSDATLLQNKIGVRFHEAPECSCSTAQVLLSYGSLGKPAPAMHHAGPLADRLVQAAALWWRGS